jgi:hypothetical protein
LANAAFVKVAVDAAVDFTIIYPNGGSAGSPANVSINSRYVMPNPFPGYHVLTEGEVQLNGVWGKTGWIYGGAGQGVAAGQLGDDIIVQTGGEGLLNIGHVIGTVLPSAAYRTTPLPCRVKVWKVKGAVA